MRIAGGHRDEVIALRTAHISFSRRSGRSEEGGQKHTASFAKALVVLTTGALAIAGCGSSPPAPAPTQSSRSTSHAVTSTAASSTTAEAREATVSAGQNSEVSALAGGITATMHGATHHPRVGARWPFQLTVARQGRPAMATVTYEYVFGGQVVARRAQHSFTGRFTDEIEWPSSAVGYPLEFRAAIVAEGVRINLDYPVVVAR